MEEKRKNCNKVSIYLIKSEVGYDDVLKQYAYKKTIVETENSKTYYLASRSTSPKWLSTYFHQDKIEEIQTENAKVISLHKIKFDEEERIFAIPFGQGLYLLNEDVIEEQFGIKILLNSIDKDGFRQIHTTSYAKDHKTASEQMAKKMPISEFGFDLFNDLMRKATAKSNAEEFYGNVITGGNLLSTNVPVDINNIEEFLKFCYKRYQEKKYREEFSWIDNIKEVKAKEVKEKLRQEIVNKINNKDFDKVWLAVPENIDWELINGFKFTVKGDLYDDIYIEEFLKRLPNETITSYEQLENRYVASYSNDGDDYLNKWKISQCLVGEIELSGKAYCISNGKLYELNNDFSKEVIDNYEKIELYTVDFPMNTGLEEKDYNILLQKSLPDSLLMDRVLIKADAPGHSSIELCDVLTSTKDLIHVKKNGSSSVLSHLFNQANVSADFLQDSKFRNTANTKIYETYGQNYFVTDFKTEDYTIVLAIITNSNVERPKIPFFSKVSIGHAMNLITRRGYKFKIKNIYNNKTI